MMSGNNARASRVVVLGATSQISRFLFRRLSAAGFIPIAVTRGRPTAFGLAAHVTQGLGEEDFVPPLPPSDVVVTTAPLTTIGSALAAARACRARRIVAIGSMSIIAKASSGAPADRALVSGLAAAEARLAEEAAAMGASWTVLRPTMIYGAGTDRNVAFLARFIRRTGFFPVPPGARGLRQPVHADDLAAAIVAATTAPGAENRAFSLGGAERIFYPDMVRRIFRAMGRTPRLLPVPGKAFRMAVNIGRIVPPLAFVGPEMVDRMYTDLVADNDGAMRLLDYSPRGFEPDPEALGIAP
mgnify:CR=1 FL=1